MLLVSHNNFTAFAVLLHCKIHRDTGNPTNEAHLMHHLPQITLAEQTFTKSAQTKKRTTHLSGKSDLLIQSKLTAQSRECKWESSLPPPTQNK